MFNWFRRVKRAKLDSEKGQSLVEMTIIVPLLIFMFLGLIEVGWAIRGYLVLLNINREGARFAARGDYLDFSITDVETLGYHTVREHIITSLSEQLPIDVDPASVDPNATVIINHYLIDTEKPCDGDTCSTSCDSLTSADDYFADDLIGYPGKPQYEHFSVTYGITQPSRINHAALAAELKQENDIFNCNILERSLNPENEDMAINSVILVEILYEQPQLLGMPIISNDIFDPVPLYTQTAMRISPGDLSQGEGCELMPIVIHEDVLGYPLPSVNTPFPDIRDGGGTGNFGWIRWRDDDSVTEIPNTNSEQYLEAGIKNNRLPMHDYVNPNDSSDTVINAGDWVMGYTGNVAAAADELEEYINDIVTIPVWSESSGSGSNLEYKIVRFVKFRITDVKFTGNPKYISGVYLGEDPSCPTDEISSSTSGNTPPQANNDVAITNINTPVVINVLDNDTDAESNIDPATVNIVSNLGSASATIDTATGAITYEPPNNKSGNYQFEYEVCDAEGACSNTATVNIAVLDPSNNAPVANADTATTDEDTPVIINVMANDSDPDSDPITLNGVTILPANGTAVAGPGAGEVTYTPPAGQSGTFEFQYEICDDGAACSTGTVSVTVNAAPVNNPPIATDDSATTAENTAVIVDVLANDQDGDSGTNTDLNPASVTVTSGPASGSTSVNSTTGAITFNPPANQGGSFQFDYQVCDSGGLCDTATVTITVNGLPVAVDDTTTTATGTPVVIDVLANDTDDSGLNPASVTITSGPSSGSTSVNTATGEITYTPPAGQGGSFQFDYQVCDNGGLCDTATVTVNIAVSGLIAEEDFDGNSSGWNGSWYFRNSRARISDNQPHNGQYSLRLRGSGYTWAERPVDLSSVSNATLSFWWRTNGNMDYGDWFYVYVSDDGGNNWERVFSHRNDQNSYEYIEIDLGNEGVSFTSNFIVSFDIDASRSDERVYVDDIEITAN